MNDYSPGFQDYLNNIKEKNPKVDKDYTIADLAVLYTLGCARAEMDGKSVQLPWEQLVSYTVICCGADAVMDETVWLKGENNGH